MRQLSINRRKPNLVDLLVKKTPDAYSYNLKWGQNFDDVAFVDLLTSPNTGFRDPAINDESNLTLYGDHVRILFDPSTYAVPDDKVWWLKMSPLDSNGAEIFTTPALMVLQPNMGGSHFPQLVITGSAPNSVSIDNSLEIDLPKQMRDMRVHNELDIYIAFNSEGPEILLPGSPFPKDMGRWSTQSSVLVRGNGEVSQFSLSFTLAHYVR
jgi:hypothetical protein